MCIQSDSRRLADTHNGSSSWYTIKGVQSEGIIGTAPTMSYQNELRTHAVTGVCILNVPIGNSCNMIGKGNQFNTGSMQNGIGRQCRRGRCGTVTIGSNSITRCGLFSTGNCDNICRTTRAPVECATSTYFLCCTHARTHACTTVDIVTLPRHCKPSLSVVYPSICTICTVVKTFTK